MMDLADVIAEEETLARGRRMDTIAVASLPITADSNSPIPMDIVRFGIAVAAFRELRRHVDDAIRQYNNQRARAVNVQTRVGGHSRRQQASSPTGGQRARNAEHHGMVSSVWEDARTVASKSAQLLHALATLQHDEFNKNEEADPAVISSDDSVEEITSTSSPDGRRNIVMEKLVEEQKCVQAILGRHWDQNRQPQQQKSSATSDDAGAVSGGNQFSLPPMQLFDPLLEKLQMALN